MATYPPAGTTPYYAGLQNWLFEGAYPDGKTKSPHVIDWPREYGVDVTGRQASSNVAAFAALMADLRRGSTRERIRDVLMLRRGDLVALDAQCPIEDIAGVTFHFLSGPGFNEDRFTPVNGYFVHQAAPTTALFAIRNSGGGTNQRGLQWVGFWNILSATHGAGYGISIDHTNNWGGPRSGLSFPSGGGTMALRRGLVLEAATDNAHGMVGALFSAEVAEGAVYVGGGTCYLPYGNISIRDGQVGIFGRGDQPGALAAAELHVGRGVKIDGAYEGGGGGRGIDWRGAMLRCEASFEGFVSKGTNYGIAIDIHRTHDNPTSGRYNLIDGVNFTGRGDGSMIPWRIHHDPGVGPAFGNRVIAPGYSNCVHDSDAIMLPNGYRVLDCVIDYARFANGGSHA
jgi:hypothetical protein